jgi:flagellar biosynthetic protein FliR
VLAISLMLALALNSTLHVELPPGTLVAAIASEFLIGLLLAAGFRLAMTSVSIAGELIGLQMGVSAASIYDPMAASSSSVVPTFMGFLYSVIFLTLNGHHQVLRVLSESFTIVPPLKAGMPSFSIFMSQVAEMAAFGCRLAAPIGIPIMLISLGTGLISRIFPQANVISLSYGLAMLTGLVLLAVMIGTFDTVVNDSIQHANKAVLRMLNALAGN